MGREKSAAMLPKQGPDFLAVRLREGQLIQIGAIEESKSSFGVIGWNFRESRLDLEEEHQPMRLTAVAVLGSDSDQVEITWLNCDTEFFARFTASAHVRTFALLDMNFATARAPEAAVWLTCSFEQQNLVLFVETVEKRRNLEIFANFRIHGKMLQIEHREGNQCLTLLQEQY